MNPDHHELVAILDFGGQYTQLIARRVRDLHVFCEIVSCDTSAARLAERSPRHSYSPVGLRVSTQMELRPVTRRSSSLGFQFWAYVMVHS